MNFWVVLGQGSELNIQFKYTLALSTDLTGGTWRSLSYEHGNAVEDFVLLSAFAKCAFETMGRKADVSKTTWRDLGLI